MPKLVLADTGPLFALADPSDQYHLHAQEQLERLTAAGASWPITYLTLAGDYIQASDLIMACTDQQITMFDAVAAAVAERLRLAVWTYDRHFDRMGSKRWQ